MPPLNKSELAIEHTTGGVIVRFPRAHWKNWPSQLKIHTFSIPAVTLLAMARHLLAVIWIAVLWLIYIPIILVQALCRTVWRFENGVLSVDHGPRFLGVHQKWPLGTVTEIHALQAPSRGFRLKKFGLNFTFATVAATPENCEIAANILNNALQARLHPNTQLVL